MYDQRFERYRTAYLEMAERAKYRPAAPNDGCGGILLSKAELQNRERLEAEARRYAAQYLADDDTMTYPIGCPDGRAARAFCYTIEAARTMCGPTPRFAETLLRLAIAELRAQYPRAAAKTGRRAIAGDA